MDFAMLDQDLLFRLEHLLWMVCQFYVAAVLLALLVMVVLFTDQAVKRSRQRSRAA